MANREKMTSEQITNAIMDRFNIDLDTLAARLGRTTPQLRQFYDGRYRLETGVPGYKKDLIATFGVTNDFFYFGGEDSPLTKQAPAPAKQPVAAQKPAPVEKPAPAPVAKAVPVAEEPPVSAPAATPISAPAVTEETSVEQEAPQPTQKTSQAQSVQPTQPVQSVQPAQQESAGIAERIVRIGKIMDALSGNIRGLFSEVKASSGTTIAFPNAKSKEAVELALKIPEDKLDIILPMMRNLSQG